MRCGAVGRLRRERRVGPPKRVAGVGLGLLREFAKANAFFCAFSTAQKREFSTFLRLPLKFRGDWKILERGNTRNARKSARKMTKKTRDLPEESSRWDANERYCLQCLWHVSIASFTSIRCHRRAWHLQLWFYTFLRFASCLHRGGISAPSSTVEVLLLKQKRRSWSDIQGSTGARMSAERIWKKLILWRMELSCCVYGYKNE